MTYLVATMHMPGIERDAKVLLELMEAHSHGHLQHYGQLMAELKMDEHRHQMELYILMDALRQHQLHRHYVGVTFGGDLNFEVESPEYRQLERAGFTDTAQIATGMPMWNTYDPMNNPLARIIHTRFCCNRRSAATTSLRPTGSPLGPSPCCTSTHRVLRPPRAGLAMRLSDFATNRHE